MGPPPSSSGMGLLPVRRAPVRVARGGWHRHTVRHPARMTSSSSQCCLSSSRLYGPDQAISLGHGKEERPPPPGHWGEAHRAWRAAGGGDRREWSAGGEHGRRMRRAGREPDARRHRSHRLRRARHGGEAVGCCRPSGLLRARGRQLSPWAGRRAVPGSPFVHPTNKSQSQLRTLCQLSNQSSSSVVSSRFLPSPAVCGLESGSERRAPRGDEVTGDALLTAFRLPTPLPRLRRTLPHRALPAPQAASHRRAAGTPPRFGPSGPSTGLEESGDPPGIDWIGLLLFLGTPP
jgi:hypothetical protein